MLLSPDEEKALGDAVYSRDPLVIALLQLIARIRVVYQIDYVRGQREPEIDYVAADPVNHDFCVAGFSHGPVFAQVSTAAHQDRNREREQERTYRDQELAYLLRRWDRQQGS